MRVTKRARRKTCMSMPTKNANTNFLKKSEWQEKWGDKKQLEWVASEEQMMKKMMSDKKKWLNDEWQEKMIKKIMSAKKKGEMMSAKKKW